MAQKTVEIGKNFIGNGFVIRNVNYKLFKNDTFYFDRFFTVFRTKYAHIGHLKEQILRLF